MIESDEGPHDDRSRDEAFHYGNRGWAVGLCLSAALLWAMFAFADRIG